MKCFRVIRNVWLRRVFGVITICLLGLELAFNVYAVDLKQALNYTQTEVELVSVSGMAGLGASLIEPFLVSRLGYHVGCFIVWLATTGSLLLMWIAVLYRDMFTHWVIAVCAFQFLMHMSEISANIRLSSNVVNTFPEEHTAKIMGLTMAVSCSAKILYGQTLEHFYVNNLQGFFVTAAVAQSIFLGTTYVMFATQPDEQTKKVEYETLDDVHLDLKRTRTDQTTPNSHDTLLQSDIPSKSNDSKKIVSNCDNMLAVSDKLLLDSDKILPHSGEHLTDTEKHPVATMMRSPYFHLTFWPSVIIYSIMYTFMNNVTSIAFSFGLDEPVYTVYVLSITVIVGRLSTGIIFDIFRSAFTGWLLLIIGSIAASMAQLFMILSENPNKLYFITIFCGVSLSVSLTISSSVLALKFGQGSLPYIIGFIFCFNACFCLVFSILVGALYDQASSADGFCYGTSCFFSSSMILLMVSSLVTVVQIGNLVINGHKY